MKSVLIGYAFVNGEYRPSNKENEIKREQFMVYCLQKRIEYFQCEYRTVSADDRWKDDQRASYFAYMRTVIVDGHEEFSKGIPGSSMAAKIDCLDRTLRGKWCELNTEYFDEVRLSLPGEKKIRIKREIFSISREKCRLSIEQLEKYYKFAKDTLYRSHEDFTAQYGEKWSLPYWIE